MTKEQLKEYLKKVLADSKRKPHGKNEYEKANDKLQIDGNLRMFATGIQEGMYMLPVNKLKEAEKFFSEKDLVSARNSFLSSTITHYIEDNKIDQNLISDELKAYKASYYKADYDRYKDAISKYISKDVMKTVIKDIEHIYPYQHADMTDLRYGEHEETRYSA